MSRLLRMTIVLGIAVAAIGTAAAVPAEPPSDASDRALASEMAVPTDSHERARSPVVVSTDSHERAQPVDVTAGPVAAEEAGWDVSWTNILLGVAIGAVLVVAIMLMVNAIRRHPPRGHPPLAHR